MSNSPAFATQSIDMVTASTKAVHGKTIADWDNATVTATIDGCSIQPLQGTDNEDHRDADLQQWVAYIYDLDKGAAIAATQHVRYAGLEFKIQGPVRPFVFGMRSDHYVLNLTVWEEH